MTIFCELLAHIFIWSIKIIIKSINPWHNIYKRKAKNRDQFLFKSLVCQSIPFKSIINIISTYTWSLITWIFVRFRLSTKLFVNFFYEKREWDKMVTSFVLRFVVRLIGGILFFSCYTVSESTVNTYHWSVLKNKNWNQRKKKLK